ncbi:hypothetical protein P168DRAFT_305773 [Aspergillus campestris IBT 28561]|uniref:Uncharacterized protein n=1 Tax=Aspergillus campestris (strain IBT 28561) TaxID=1392248 RepID=A0A2I1CXY4_ASPC2|nr:uncharacterized protein P168DRAFT_305773 [Aspergillus campestris IBT 28561]PKY02471.1 hypothetical protein P168DRAFT_305773 [Aspergillus campestris IBT 28561]
MFCLRSWLPLLFIPTNASPLFILSFVTLTYLLHRPCIYCSALLLILFLSSCNWSDHCFVDLRSDWFSPRLPSSSTSSSDIISASSSPSGAAATMTYPNSDSLAGFVFDSINSTTKALAGAAMEEAQRRFAANGSSIAAAAAALPAQEEWTGVGLEWLRSLLGRREWTLPCVDVKVRL